MRLLAENRQAELQNIQRAHEIRLDLVADLVLVLVLACADDGRTTAVRNQVDASEVRDGFVHHGFDGGARAHVTEGAETVGMPVLHRGGRVEVGLADGDDEVVVPQGAAGEGAADVACCTEDLRWVRYV